VSAGAAPVRRAVPEGGSCDRPDPRPVGTPFGFFATWFACDGASDHGYFCDPRVDAAIKRAQALKATNPRAATNAWAELDRQMVDRAVWVPMIDEHAIDFVSARVHNYQAHPY
jgi:ABC-type transport system substrate-binding protein